MPPIFRSLFFIGDMILLNVSIIASYYFIGQTAFGDELINSVYLILFSNLAWLFLVLTSNPYGFTRSYGVVSIFKSQISFIFVHLLVVASLIVFFKKSYYPIQVANIYILFVPLFFLWKLFILYIGNFRKNSFARINFIIVGKGDLARGVRKYFLVNNRIRYCFLRTFEPKIEPSLLDQLTIFCKENFVHEIYCCLEDFKEKEIEGIIEFSLNRLIKVKLISGANFLKPEPIELFQYQNAPFIDSVAVPLDDYKNRVLKRIFDLVFSSVVIGMILSWVLPIIYLASRFDSPGPFFFKQIRSGRGNKIFYCLKIRTMLVNQEADIKQATKDDARVTRFGRFLRKTSLDEIPQFFNVLVGEMSVIGPRPHPLKLNEKFSESIERFMSRHYVKPGITGLAQCLGYRGETKNLIDMENRVRMDRYYIENWSFKLDIKIIFLTIASLVKGSDNAF
jgi:putative colanic acid biosynthesis UDP-glucose lipid carrier transferase